MAVPAREIAGMHVPALSVTPSPSPTPKRRPTPKTDHRAMARSAPPPPSTVGELADRWLTAKAAEGALSIDSYRSFVATHVGLARDLPLEALSEVEITTELRAWAAARQADGYAAATVGTLASFWAALLAHGGIRLDVGGLRLPRRSRVSSRSTEVLSLAEMATLVRSRRGPLFLRAWTAGLLLTGFRVGEAIAASWCHLDRSAPGLPRLTLPVAWRTKARALTECKADPVASHAITHPGSLPPSAEFGQAARGSFRSYVHTSWEARVGAIESLRLPAVEVAAEAQLAFDLGGST